MGKTRILIALLSAISLLALAACGGDGTEEPVTTTPTETPTPTAQPSTTPTQTPAQPSALDEESVLALGTENLAELVTNSPVLMSCISERLGFGTLMELAQRVPTEDEVDQLVSCFERAGADSASGAAEAPAKNPLWC